MKTTVYGLANPLSVQVIKYFLFLLGLFLNLCPQTGRPEDIGCNSSAAFVRAETIPPRPLAAISGSDFARQTVGMTGSERQQAALTEFRNGNIPEFSRNLKPVSLSYERSGKEAIEAVIWVMPDYLAIGSNDDFIRMPLNYTSAVAIANEWGFILPTRKMVDAIYEQATCHLKPDPLPPGPRMRSSEYYLKHRDLIRTRRKEEGCALGELVSGHKKDVVLTNRLNRKPGRIAIYGWHRKNGEPIQPLSTVHGEGYADYSHGIRLIYNKVWINGEALSILDALQDPLVAPVLTYEGVITRLLKMLRLK